ncbi:hypothetical protein CALCODRAFT_279656 [Calocera cornea HHB12733]|uniref:Uncharacterized protein n=1 Tax=Calocera cornea HHB12733 TaxID=1353952 RepID=A0A165JS09_9BASI|nr:hypothetical protein CALCODRAFT_279656 [Calocera cornea HHB12733]
MRLPTLSRSSTPVPPGPPSTSSTSTAPSTATSPSTDRSHAHTLPRAKGIPSPLSLPPAGERQHEHEPKLRKQASYNPLRSFFRKPFPLSTVPTPSDFHFHSRTQGSPDQPHVDTQVQGFLQPPPPLSAGSSACSSDTSSLKTPTDELPEEGANKGLSLALPGSAGNAGVELSGLDDQLLVERRRELRREREEENVKERDKEREREVRTRTPSTTSSKLKTLRRMGSWLSAKSSSSATSAASVSRKQSKRTTSAPGRVPTLTHPDLAGMDLPPVPPLPEAVAAHKRTHTPPLPVGRRRPLVTPPAPAPAPPPFERPRHSRPGSRSRSRSPDPDLRPSLDVDGPRVPFPHPRHIPVLLSTLTRLSLPPHVSPHPLLVHPDGTPLFPSSTRPHDPSQPRPHSSPTLRRLHKFSVLARLAPGSPRPLTQQEARELAHLSWRALPQPPPAARPLSPGSIAPKRIQTCHSPPQVRKFLAREGFEARCALWVYHPERGLLRETISARKPRQPLAQAYSPGLKALAKGLEPDTEEEDETTSSEEGSSSSSEDDFNEMLAPTPKPRRASVATERLLAPAVVIRPASSLAPAHGVRAAAGAVGQRPSSAMSVYSTATSRDRRRSAPLLQLEHPYPHASHAHSLHPSPTDEEQQLTAPRNSSRKSKFFSPIAEYGTPGNPAMPLVPDSARLHLLPPGYRKEQEWLALEEQKRRAGQQQQQRHQPPPSHQQQQLDRAQRERLQQRELDEPEKQQLMEEEREKERHRAEVRRAWERSQRGRRGGREDDSPIAEGEGWDVNNRRARPVSTVITPPARPVSTVASSVPTRPLPHSVNTLPTTTPVSNPARPGRSRTATAPASIPSTRDNEDTPPTSHSGSSPQKTSGSQPQLARGSVRLGPQKERLRTNSASNSRLKTDRPMSMLALPSFPSAQGTAFSPSFAGMPLYAASPMPVSPISPVGIQMPGLPSVPSVSMHMPALAASQSLAQLQMQMQYQAQAHYAASQSMAQLHFQQMQMQQHIHAQAQAQAVAMAQMTGGGTQGMRGSRMDAQGGKNRRQTVDFGAMP